ncbi:FHA domain-containing protein [Actinomadura sp. CNU-125]|uniref:FHA domain-containing protein n=1 Tax=Actinomadura sp. CNU-125 TaxID=1904961 RepID=UPI0013018E5E|nr:FHA domain-containing protein [Actinomadura sp. CNU-125]
MPFALVAEPATGGAGKGALPPTRKAPAASSLLLLEFPDGRLVVGAGTRRPLGRDPSFSPDAALLARHDTVSSRHAVVEFREDGTATIEDVGSRNATFVNGSRLAPHRPRPLRDGDEVWLSTLLAGTVRITGVARRKGDTR